MEGLEPSLPASETGASANWASAAKQRMGWTYTNRAPGLESNQLLTVQEQARQLRSLGRYSAR